MFEEQPDIYRDIIIEEVSSREESKHDQFENPQELVLKEDDSADDNKGNLYWEINNDDALSN